MATQKWIFVVTSKDSANSEPEGEEGIPVPGWTPEVGTRIREVIRRVGGLKAASTIVDMKAEQIGKWRDGRARPPFFALQRLAAEAGVSLDWISGVDQPRAAAVAPSQVMDDELMGRITDAIARLYKDERVSLPAIDLGRLAARKYAEIVAATDDSEERLAMVKLIVTQLRADIRATAAAPGSGKASA